MDVARYGDYATLAYTNAKVQENYRRRFRITFPNEELPGGPAAADDADPRPADRGERRLGRDRSGLEHALWFQRGRPRAEGGRHLPPLERLGLRRRGGRGRPRAGRDDRDLELRQVPGHRAGRRGVAVVAAHRADAGAGPDHADRDAQRRRAGSSASSRSPGRPRPTSSTCSGRCRPRSTTRAGSATTCRPTGRSGSRSSGWAWSGCRSTGPRSRDVLAAVAPDLDLSTEAFPFMTFRRVDLGHDAGARSPGSTTPATSATSCGSRPEYQRDAVRPDRGRRRAARAAAVRDAGADVAPAREELRDVVPRVPADLHAARGRHHPLHQARPRVHRPGGARGRARRAAARRGGSSRSSSSPTRTTRPTSSATSRSGTTARSSAGSPRAATATHVEAVDRARVRAGRAGDAGRPGRRAASRSRSSAGAGRRGSSPSRCSTRRASGCASDRGAGAGGAVGSSSTARPIAFDAGRLARGRDPAGRRGARARRDAVPRRRLRELPRGRRRRRLRPDVPGRGAAGHGRRAASGGRASRRSPSSTGATPARAGRRRGRGRRARRRRAVVGGSARPASRRPATAASVLDAADGDRGRRHLPRARRSSPGRRGGMLHVDGRRDRRRDRRRRDPAGLPGQRPRRDRDARGPPSGSRAAGVDLPGPRRDRSAGELVRFEGDDGRPGRAPSSRAATTAARRRPACDTVVVDLGRAPRDVLARMARPSAPVAVVGAAADDHPLPPADRPGRRRLPLHGHDRRRPRRGAGPRATPSSSCSSARRSAGHRHRARAAPACRTSGP